MRCIVDAESYVDVSLRELVPFVDPAWRRDAEAGRAGQVMITDVGDPLVGRRFVDQAPAAPPGPPPECRVVYADPMAGLGLNPLTELHTALAEAYARWLCDVYLPVHADARGMLYLPAVDPGACLRFVEAYGGRSGVAGAYLTTNATLQPHDNRLAPLYAEMEERGMVLAFQPTPSWPDQPFDALDHYLAFWSLGTPFHQCFTAINWLFHGMPERFPKLPCVFCSAGLAWLNFLSHRLDREFLQRPSEAPSLKERPSHYLRRFFYTTYPIEQVRDPAYLEAVIGQVGTGRLLYGSGSPHWDADGPDAVERLTFLDDGQRQAVLAGNAARLFGLDIREEAR